MKEEEDGRPKLTKRRPKWVILGLAPCDLDDSTGGSLKLGTPRPDLVMTAGRISSNYSLVLSQQVHLDVLGYE